MFALVSINGCTSFLANYKKMKSVSRYLHTVNILFTNKIGKKKIATTNSNVKLEALNFHTWSFIFFYPITHSLVKP